jgi:Putative DNA-binding domain
VFPDDLSKITFEDVVAIVERLEFEPGPVDFKEVLNPSVPRKGQATQSLRRAVSAMANSAGGWIVFGVKDRATGLRARDRIVGIPIGGDLRREFGDKLGGIQPEVYFDASPAIVPLPSATDRGVFIVRIPVSLRRPHQVTETGVFYRRGDGGAASPMSYYEVRDQLLLTEERGRKLDLLRLEVTMYRVISQMIRNKRPHPIQAAFRFDVTSIKALLPDVIALLPSDSGLIDRLVTLPVGAGIVNLFLDNASNPILTTFSHWTAYLEEMEKSMLAALDGLDESSATVEARFNQLLGPSTLTSAGIPEPNPEPPASWEISP